MYVQWRSLASAGIAFWSILCYTDFLGDCSWKKYSQHLEEVLNGHRNEIATKMEPPKAITNWSSVFWNVFAFVCFLIICSAVKSMSWVLWKFYNVFRIRKTLLDKSSNSSTNINSESFEKQNCKVLFKNQVFSPKLEAQRLENLALVQEHVNLSKQIDDLKKEKNDLAQQLVLAQKDNLTARQQIEEYKLETFMMKEKLQRTANTLKENLKYKDFASANQEMIIRKAHNLEVHLIEISKDRELLRSKLSALEKKCEKLEDKLKSYEQPEQETESNIEQVPEKDAAKTPRIIEPLDQADEIPEPDVDMCKFQKKILELQKSIGNMNINVKNKEKFEANSKISMDLEESPIDTSKETVSSSQQDEKITLNNLKKADINLVKQNLLNYSAYKVQMLRPKLKLDDIKENLLGASETTTSSSDDSNSPQRLISSTIEFQNFLKTLTTNSNNSLNFHKNAVF